MLKKLARWFGFTREPLKRPIFIHPYSAEKMEEIKEVNRLLKLDRKKYK